MKDENIVKHKFEAYSNMSFHQVFNFAFERTIPVLQSLAKEFGEERFFKALKNAAYEAGFKEGQESARQLPCNDFAAYAALGRESSYFGDHILTKEIVEDTPEAFKVKVTECLWARVFREMGAEEIGYLFICHPDYADCQGFNPHITMIRSKTLMQGDDCCNHRFIWNA
ncbi:MAG: L-2-amino-thiazoline-4-carboxylic acid hydrolase [Anaerolineales bacterium]|nr:L-2-amino-thiazoline-4-carboxylic acid hydrolase [Anaerolineales bacterium]